MAIGARQGTVVGLFKAKSSSEPGFTTLTLAAAILLYPLVALLAPKAMVALLVLPVLACLTAAPNRSAVFSALPPKVLMLIAGLAAWSLVTVWWSPRPTVSLELWFRVVGIGLCGMVLFATAAKASADDVRFLDGVFFVSGWLFIALFTVELLSDGALIRLAVSLWNLLTPWDTGPPTPSLLLLQGSAALAIFAWPCMLAIRRRSTAAVASLFALAVTALLVNQNMEASLVAFAGALVVFLAVYRFPRWGSAAFLAGLALVNLALALAAFEIVSAEQQDGINLIMSGGTKERLYILDYVYEKINQHPLMGWGFDGSRAIGQETLSNFGNASIPLHPHNLWAQAWLELGLIGFVLVVSLAVAVTMTIAASGRGRTAVAVAVAAVATYLLIGNISYGMWQNWWLALAWLNAGFLALTAVRDGAGDA